MNLGAFILLGIEFNLFLSLHLQHLSAYMSITVQGKKPQPSSARLHAAWYSFQTRAYCIQH